MPNSQDDHRFCFDPVAQNVGPDRCHFAHAIARVATSVRKFGQAVGHFGQPLSELYRSYRIKCRDIGQDRFEMADRVVSPNNGAQLIRRAWV